MASVTYDDRSLMVDAERVWLVSGSVHYFRIPAELWADRLLKAKRAGLNCISTYVPWNFHEPIEGQWRLGGDQDVLEFMRIAHDLGLYVILRPGPYICSEWDFGGLPGWLTSKPGMTYRTNNAAFMHYFDKYFRQILPRLAEMQVTRGGNIILVQNENEYTMTTAPDRINYLTFINQLIRRSGFDIPIINCNLFSDPAVPENIECVNGSVDLVEKLKRLRLRRPDAPLLVTEFWSGWYDRWGQQHNTCDAREVGRRAMEILGCGAQFNHYMWSGGTNFAFWGSRSRDSYLTTSYDFDAPVSEGGALTRKYYLTKLVNMLANHMGPYLSACAMEEPGVSVLDSTNVLNMYGPEGRWAVVTNNGDDEITNVTVSLPEGPSLEVSLEPLGATAIPVDVRLTATQTLDYTNLLPLGFFGGKILVLHGPEQFAGRVSVNGNEINPEVPKGDELEIIEHQNLTVVVISSGLAERTWALDDSLVFGPRFVGETLEDVVDAPGSSGCAILSMEGKLSHRKVKAPPAKKPTAPRIGQWTRLRVCTEPAAADLEWTPLDRPTDLDKLGVHYGYAWYQVRIHSERARKRYLMMPECGDRATVYLNGNLLGVWGRGPGATLSPISANFKRGQNVLTLLLDNLGRFSASERIGELKGLYGPIYDGRPLRTAKFKIKRQEGFSKRVVSRQLVHLIPGLEKLPVFSAELDLPLTSVTPLHLSFENLAYDAAVLCNERMVGFFPLTGTNFGDVTLGVELKKGKNVIKLLLWGDVKPKDLEKIRLCALKENLTQKAQWAYREWSVPTEQGPIVGKNRPAWYVAKFKHTPQSVPLFINILSAKKGQVFLNSHNVGRFWTVGPQHRYYLPECWLQDENELLIFEEQGNIPSGSRLEFSPEGPYHD